MASALITLTTAGADTGPFQLLSNTNSFAYPFEGGISKSALLAGYTSNLIPAGTTTIRVKSASVGCTNYVDIVVGGLTTTTTTTTTIPNNSFLTNNSSYDLTIKFTLWVKNSGGTYAPIYSTPTAVFIYSGDQYGFYQTVYPGVYPTSNKGFKLTVDSGSIGIYGTGTLDPSIFYLVSALGTTSQKVFTLSSPSATVADGSNTVGMSDNVYAINAFIGSSL